MLRLENVTVGFGDNTVFENLNLDLTDSDFISVIGSSGCGKTTLLNLIAGTLKPNNGKVISNMKVSYMYQEPRLFPWLSAVRNVNAVLDDNKNTLDKAKQILKKVGITEYDKYPKQQSGGMQQRTALARALAYDSDLLLLDEPFSALDPENKKQMLDIIKNDGRKVILVTHDMKTASLSDRIIDLNKKEL